MSCELLNFTDRVVLRVTEHLVDSDISYTKVFNVDADNGACLSLEVVILFTLAIADLPNFHSLASWKEIQFHAYSEPASFNLAHDACSNATDFLNILHTHAKRLVDWTLGCAQIL